MFSKRGCECPSGQILIERGIDGKLLATAKCVECTDGSQPSKDKTICQPCLYSPILKVKSLIWLRGDKSAYKLEIDADNRDCCTKFATGLNIIISHSAKNIWVIKLSFCQNDSSIGGPFWQKDSLITDMLFALLLITGCVILNWSKLNGSEG